MIGALNLHCRPDTAANAFTTLMSLLNENMGDSEDILAFRSCFGGMINEMSRCNVAIPPILMTSPPSAAPRSIATAWCSASWIFRPSSPPRYIIVVFVAELHAQ